MAICDKKGGFSKASFLGADGYQRQSDTDCSPEAFIIS